MDYGDLTYSRLYGMGGAIDQLSGMYALSGLGDTGQDRESVSVAPEQSLQSYFAATGGALRFDPGIGIQTTTEETTPAPDARECGCLVSALGLDAASAQQLQTLCAQDPGAFKEVLRSQGYNPDELCKPWYAKKTTLLVGGGILAAGLLAWAVL